MIARLGFRLVMVGAIALASSSRARPGEDGDPTATDVVERAESRLVQLDVNVTGPPAAVADLTAADFKLKLATIPIREFTVDRLCRPPSVGDRDDASRPAEAAPGADAVASPTLSPTTFLFYFDQLHMTLPGRARALDVVRELIPKLIRDGNRGFIVSNAESLKTFTDTTTDPDLLLDALDLLENDKEQWDLSATHEDNRIFEILEELRSGSVARADTLIKIYAADELWRAERDLRRFAMVLGRLAAVEPPKAVIYLADNMRSNAGTHYLRLRGEFGPSSLKENELRQGQFLGAGTSFDGLVNEASSHGTRVYTIQAAGLVPLSSLDAPLSYTGIGGRNPAFVAPAGRVNDAQETLAGMALETGGQAFLNGVPARKIAGRILADLSCLYLVSFPADGLPEDTPLGVKLKVRRPGVEARTRGRIVIQSASSRLTSRLLSAFTAPGADGGPTSLGLSLIPSGYTDGTHSIIVQISVPGSELPTTTWDLGASVVSRGTAEGSSTRITVASAGAPVIFQQTMSFAPGPFEVVAVAHNVTTDTTVSRELRGECPKPTGEPASIGLIAAVQAIRGAIRRNDDVVTSGPVAYGEPEALRGDRPTALVSMVCRGSQGRPLEVERRLEGQETVSFPPVSLEKEPDACAVVRDLIPPDTMTPGAFRYDIRVLDRGEELAHAEKIFRVGAMP